MENLRVEEPKPKPTNKDNKGYRKGAKCFAWISVCLKPKGPRSNFGQCGWDISSTGELGGSDGRQI
jgi:hypothetical protein